ncbi:ABC transporter permease [Ferrimicrobium sp.]|uniref:ABC transporter permease n=1 Tax=Ferrimicrobium sp. TaxID=2926050 RepID=UPI0026026086|nr:ABC transporter permease [Ferrimicrobium sp.]
MTPEKRELMQDEAVTEESTGMNGLEPITDMDEEFEELLDEVEPSEQGYISGWRLMVRSLRENRAAMVGFVLIVLLILFCFVGPVIYPTNQVTTVITRSNLAPSASYPLGTDSNGFNILGRLMVAGQLSLEVGISVAIIATVFGALWGAVAGWFGGIVDAVMMRIVDTLLAIPWIFLFLFLTSVMKPSVGLIIGVLSLLSWLVPARLARAETLSLRNRDFVQATRMLGGTGKRIVIRHIIPNAMGVIVVNATLQVADSILALALLSYLGFGPPPPTASWGGMLSNGINFLFDGYWWSVYPVAILIILTVVAFNFLGDGVRDALEVRLRRR